MVICLSTSMRFKEQLKQISAKLDSLRIPHLLPPLDIPKEIETPELTPHLVCYHFAKIKQSAAMLVVNPGGYLGNSVKVEIGYAKAAGKKVYFMERTNQPELDCLADGFLSVNDLSILKQ